MNISKSGAGGARPGPAQKRTPQPTGAASVRRIRSRNRQPGGPPAPRAVEPAAAAAVAVGTPVVDETPEVAYSFEVRTPTAPVDLTPVDLAPVDLAPVDREPVDADVEPDLVPTEPGKVVVVFAPKGGVGTSFVASNLAVAIADGGRRRVCLVDLDLEFGDVAIMLGVSPTRTLVDAAELPAGSDVHALVDAVVTPGPHGVDTVLAPIDPAAAESVSAATVSRVLTALRGRYAYVVVDAANTLAEHVFDTFDVAAHHVLVTAPELPSMKSLRLFLDTLDLLGAERERRTVVVNRMGGRGQIGQNHLEMALRHQIDLVLPTHDDVPVSIDGGVPLVVTGGAKHPVAAVLRGYVTDVLVGGRDGEFVGDHAGARRRRPFARTLRRSS